MNENILKKFEEIEEYDYKNLEQYEKGGYCYFYIIKYLQPSNRILHYHGITHNFNRRYTEHCSKRLKNKLHKVIWMIKFNTKGEAMSFENWSKGRGPLKSLYFNNVFLNSIPYYKSFTKETNETFTEEKKNLILFLFEIKKIIKVFDKIIYKLKKMK